MSKKNEKSEKRVRDMYRLSIETVKNLSQALSTATKEIQRDQTTGEVVTGSALYCDLLPLQVSIGNSWIWREKHNDTYDRMEMPELLKQLYLQLQMLYHYGSCKGRELPGIAWILEDGRFSLSLRDCAVNMEHPFHEERWDKPAALFAVGLNLTLLESEDPEDEGSHLYGEYDEFLSFTCEVGNGAYEGIEVRDVYPNDNYINEQAVRNILGSLDLIGDMNNEKK